PVRALRHLPPWATRSGGLNVVSPQAVPAAGDVPVLPPEPPDPIVQLIDADVPGSKPLILRYSPPPPPPPPARPFVPPVTPPPPPAPPPIASTLLSRLKSEGTVHGQLVTTSVLSLL